MINKTNKRKKMTNRVKTITIGLTIAVLMMGCFNNNTKKEGISRPNMDKQTQDSFNKNFKNPKVEAFVCTNDIGSYTIAKKDIRLVYTNDDYYMFDSSGVSYVIQQCQPAKYER